MEKLCRWIRPLVKNSGREPFSGPPGSPRGSDMKRAIHMAGTAKKTNPKLWETVKAKVTRDGKGGKPGQWSARKAQMAVA